MKQNLEKHCINGAFADITFELDDGRMKAHRAMLVSRCEVMHAMLNGNFAESHAHTVITFFMTFYNFMLIIFLSLGAGLSPGCD
jgi:5-carboxymethyl-2-hydroxymuconate isomerase